MKLAAANAIAGLVADEDINENNILPEAFDPRGYLGAAREDITAMVERKITDVLGSTDSMK